LPAERRFVDGQVSPAQEDERGPGVERSFLGVPSAEGSDGVVDLDRQPGRERRRRRDVLVHVAVRRADGGLAGEGLAAREELVEHDAAGVDVGARVRGARRDHLRGEVGDRSEDGTGRGRRRLGHGPGEAEVGDLDAAVRGDEHVLRLDVAVHQTRRVGRSEGVEHSLEHVERLAEGERAALAEHRAQVGPRHVLEGEVGGVAVAALVVHADDAGVGEPGGRPRLAPEARDDVGPFREVRVHDLERDLAFEAAVHGSVHRCHAAARDARGDLVPLVDHMTDERIGDGRSHVGSLRAPRDPLRVRRTVS